MKKEKAIIRRTRASDLKELHKFANELSAEKTYITYQGEKVSLKEERDFVDGNIKRMKDKTGIYLLLFVDGKLAGIAGATAGKKIKAHVANLGIMLRKDFRGRGYGTMLFSKLLSDSKKNIKGLKLLTLEVFDGNFAINLYKKFGFKVYGRRPKGLKYKNRYVDSIEMYLEV